MFIIIIDEPRAAKFYSLYLIITIKGKCTWNPEAFEFFLFLMEKYKEDVKKLASNHDCIKVGLWEYISFMLLICGYNNFSPPQCALKWKNAKQNYKVKLLLFFF